VDALRSAVEAMGARCAAAPGVAEGIQEATALGCEVVLVTGSLSTAAEARTALGLAPPPDRLH
jgi:phosphoglycolate phosphatase-like HAD superfamily hydrolase